MFRVAMILAAALGVAGGCGGQKEAAPGAGAVAADGGAAAAKDPGKSPGFTLTPPAGYKPATPAGPLIAAWDGPVYRNGFTPTMNVARERRRSGATEAAYAAWKQGLVETLGKSYQDVKVLSERELAGPPAGKLVIAVVTLPVPGSDRPMPLFAYGAYFVAGKDQWVVAALAAAELDAASGNISALNEPAILAAIESFRLP